MTTKTIIAGAQYGDAFARANSYTWDDLGSSPFGSWDNLTSWRIPDGAVVLQLDDDMLTVDYRTPTVDWISAGDVSVTLKISDTGTFTGEETTYNLTYLSETSYVAGRYYRWTLTVTANSEVDEPVINPIFTRYTQNLVIESLNDVGIDSSPLTTINTNLGIVKNIQATALQGDPYVVDGYVLTAAELDAITRDQVALINNGVSLSDGPSVNKFTDYPVYNFNTTGVDIASFEFDDLTPWQQISSGDDFTVETFFRWSQPTTASIFGQNDAGGIPTGEDSFNLVVDPTFDRVVWTGGVSANQYSLVSSTSSISLDTWHHVAVVKEGSTVSLYLDGVRVDSNASTSGEYLSAASVFIGQFDSNNDDTTDSQNFNGYMSNFRVSATARYNGSSYTVPTQRFATDTHTLLLLRDRLQDENGDAPNGVEYFLSQEGGAPVINSKNPPKISVINYNGDPWDGTVDLVLRGYPKIYLSDTGVVPVPFIGG